MRRPSLRGRRVSDTAVLVIDMLNAYRHEDAEKLVANVADIVEPLAGLVKTARGRDDVDLIYVNDNYGDFTADFDGIVRSALEGQRPDLVEPIMPDQHCLRVLKVRHSAFYASALDYLLGRLETRRLILTGQVTEQCILYSALDAYVRHYPVVVPPDAVAHIDPELGGAALSMMQQNMHAEILPAQNCLD
jgi:nicotinamidase-related amidase